MRIHDTLLPWLLKETADRAVCFLLENDPPVSDDQMAELLYQAFAPIQDDDERQSTVNWAFTHWKESGRKLPLRQVVRAGRLWATAGLDFNGIQKHHGSEGTRRMQARDVLSKAAHKKHGVSLKSTDEPRIEDEPDAETFGDTLVNKHISPDEEARIRLDWGPVFARLTPEEQRYAIHLATTKGKDHIIGQRDAPFKNRRAATRNIARAIQLEMPDYVKGLKGESRAAFMVNLLLN